MKLTSVADYKKLTPKKRIMHESLEQQAVIEEANLMLGKYPDLRWLHAIPNGCGIALPTRVRMQKEGVKSGVSDLFLPAPRHGWYGLYIEMKWGDNKLSDRQIEFMNYIGLNNYMAVTCWSAEAAIKTLKNYLDGPITKRCTQ